MIAKFLIEFVCLSVHHIFSVVLVQYINGANLPVSQLEEGDALTEILLLKLVKISKICTEVAQILGNF